MVEHFLYQYGLATGKKLSVTAKGISLLQDYAWPGNVRELQNVLERATALSGSAEIGPGDLMLGPVVDEVDGGEGGDSGGGQREEAGLPSLPLPDYLDRVEREAITQALARTGYNRTAAAKLLGVTFRALRYRMQRLDIREPDEPA